ncbi:MAG: 3-phosphoserine/phosphohydroxythreonine transaminase [Burkholderiales bacterium]|nr:3-phosphoserine/phosphohydroxythreonine transaminase [Burkholderiales bacterium]
MNTIYNFSAGPAVLPKEVLQEAASEMLDWHGSGMSVMEMSHRGPEFMSILAQAQADLRELLHVPANYKILFLQGGGLGENAIVPLNLVGRKPQPATVDFIHTGSWSGKSLKEAKKYANVNIAASSESTGFDGVPDPSSWKLSTNAAYVHLCTNETIDGVEYHFVPDVGQQTNGAPLVADMSSHILSRIIDVSKYGVIFGGAQKNIGPAGLTLVIVREDLLGTALPMNVPFFLKDESLNAAFLAAAKERGLLQLKGHKSVGGMRASIYNAMPIEGVQALVAFMRDFAGANG